MNPLTSRQLFLISGFVVVALGAGCARSTPPVVTPEPVPAPVAPSSTEIRPEPATSTAPGSMPTSTPGSMPSTPTTKSLTPTTTSMAPTTPAAFPGILPTAEVNKKIRIKTTKGDIVIQLMHDTGPRAASNFIYLVKRGFYNGTIFHRVIPGFMIQGGDPTGTGMGGPGYQFDNDEVKNVSYQDGIVAMANAGRNTNGSQFFIMVADYPLPPDYSIFGKVVTGLDVAHAIANAPRNSQDRPNEEVKMISVVVE